jgi:hypothetical protein
LITAPARDGTPLMSPNLYWRLRAACYRRVLGVARFYDTNSLPRLVEDQGLTVVECNGEPGRERAGTRIMSLVESALQRRERDPVGLRAWRRSASDPGFAITAG